MRLLKLTISILRFFFFNIQRRFPLTRRSDKRVLNDFFFPVDDEDDDDDG